MEALSESVEDLEWIRVEEPSAAGQVRRAAAAVAKRLGFSEHRIGEVALAATELATNAHVHARAAVVVLRERRASGRSAVELVVSDAGPGSSDFGAFSHDGNSSRGTLGIGLGAVTRLATWFDTHSVPGRGTVMVATFWNGSAPSGRPSIAALVRPFPGELVCGDAWSMRKQGDATVVLLADGLGHGGLARTAAVAAVDAFQASGAGHTPAETLRGMHGALHATRGAAIAVVRLDWALSTLVFAGIGNVAVWIDDGEERRGLSSTPGIVGHNARIFRELREHLPAHATVVMHSDGLTSKWNLSAYPGLRARDPDLIAATLMRDAAIHHDDASVIVAKAS